MSRLRDLEQRRAELAGLRTMLAATPDDPLAKPLLASRVRSLEREVAELAQAPVAAPETELFFSQGPAVGSVGLEAKFAAAVLESYPDIITDQFAAKHRGALKSTGRRRGEVASRLYLTALPRGSFGLQLGQPHREDLFEAEQLIKIMEDVTGLLGAAARSDDAFEAALEGFHPRVLKPMKRFLDALVKGHGHCRIVSSRRTVSLSPREAAAALARVTAAEEQEVVADYAGVFGGDLVNSRRFEFTPWLGGEVIVGVLGEDVTEEQANAWAALTGKPVLARMRVTTVAERSGRRKFTYDLLELDPTDPLPEIAGSPNPPPSGP